jgi:hypothetical protein
MGKKLSYLLLPGFLMVVGTWLSLWFYEEAYITTVQVHHEKQLSKEFFEGPLVRGEVLRGEVVAAYNNFGTLRLRVRTYNRVNFNRIHFLLREKGDSDWEVQNTYIVDRFVDKLLYGFGFPPIPDSKGKTYEFELSTEDGTPDNSIGFYGGYHPLASQYVFERDTLLADPQMLIFFLRAKSLSFINDPYFILYYGMFLIPAFLFPSLMFTKKKYVLFGLEILSFAYMVVIYIFLPVNIHQDTIVYIFGLSVITLILNIYPQRFTSSHAFAIAIGLLVLLEANIFLVNDFENTRIATGIFYSTVLGLILANRELLKQEKRGS